MRPLTYARLPRSGVRGGSSSGSVNSFYHVLIGFVPICVYCLNYMKFGQLIFRKIVAAQPVGSTPVGWSIPQSPRHWVLVQP